MLHLLKNLVYFFDMRGLVCDAFGLGDRFTLLDIGMFQGGKNESRNNDNQHNGDNFCFETEKTPHIR